MERINASPESMALCESIAEFDSSARRRACEGARQSEIERRFRVMADCAPVMIWMSGPDKLCDYFNQGWLDFTGRAMEEELGNGWAEGVHPDDFERCLQTYVSAFDARQPFRMEYRLRRFDGIYRWILDTGTPRFDAGGRFAGYIGSGIDVTDLREARDALQRTRDELERRVDQRTRELRRSEARRVEAEKFAAAGRLAARVAHEINNPLAGIKGAVRFLRETVPHGPEQSDYFGMIEGEIQRIAHIVQQMLGLHRGDWSIDAPTDVANCLRTTANLVLHAAGRREVRIEVDPIGPIRHVRIPDAALRQVLFNLVMNAIEASPPGGLVRIRAELTDESLLLMVRDWGPGIGDEIRRRVFEPFFTTKRASQTGGLGLGLSITKSVVESLGGEIDFVNPPEGGCLFRVAFPLSCQEAGACDDPIASCLRTTNRHS